VSNDAGQPDQAPPHGVAFAHYFPRDANAESLAMAVEALHNQQAHQIDGSLVFLLKNLDDSCYIKSDKEGKMSIASAPETRGSRIATGQVAERLKHGVVDFLSSKRAHYSSKHVGLTAVKTVIEAHSAGPTVIEAHSAGLMRNALKTVIEAHSAGLTRNAMKTATEAHSAVLMRNAVRTRP